MKFLRNLFGNPEPRTPRSRLTIEALEARFVPYAGNGLQFNFTQGTGAAQPTQQVMQAVQEAANVWSSILTDDVLLNIRIDLSSNIGAGGIASGNSVFKSKTVPEIRDALLADQTSASDAIAAAHLPAGNSASIYTTNFNTGAAFFDNNATDNNNYFTVPHSELKALGLRAANDPALDGVIRITTNLSIFDFDRSDGIAVGKTDFVGCMEHELAHIMGFVSGASTVDVRSKPHGPNYIGGSVDTIVVASPLDLFRQSATSVLKGADFDLRADPGAKYFSIDGGATNLGNFSTGLYNGDFREAGHWKDGLGIMDPGDNGNNFMDVKMRNVQALDVIGWNVAMDFGDASYQTLLGDDGPRHMLFSPTTLASDATGAPKVYLGASVESDFNGQPSANADADGDNGIAGMPTFVTGASLNLTVASSATAAKPAVLNYFVDFNQNGVFNDAGEVFVATLSSTSQLVPIVVPAGATLGNTFARFRISTAGGLGPNGFAADGEVEDYLVTVTAPQAPVVASIALLEDNLSSSIPITSNPNEGVTAFKISGIVGGTLFKSDGVTPIANGTFLSLGEGLTGVRFLPTANSNVAGRFDVESSQNGVSTIGTKATCNVSIVPVGDTPQIANASTVEGKLSAPIVVNRNPADGAEVTSFRISGITGGWLLKADGTTVIHNGDFISYADAQAGVRFMPTLNSLIAGHFDVESSQNGITVAAQSGKAGCTITITPATKLLVSGIVGGSKLNVAVDINNNLFAGSGKYIAPNGQVYVLNVKSGIRYGSMVRLQGTIGPAGGPSTLAFTLDVDSATGSIKLSYKGGKGSLVSLSAFGSVMFQ